MTSDAVLIVQLPRGGEVDRNWAEDLPPSIGNGLAVVDYLPAEPDGSLGPPPAGEVVMSVLSPEALRDQQRIQDVLRQAGAGDEPLVIVVEAAEYLRADSTGYLAAHDERLGRPRPDRAAQRGADPRRLDAAVTPTWPVVR